MTSTLSNLDALSQWGNYQPSAVLVQVSSLSDTEQPYLNDT